MTDTNKTASGNAAHKPAVMPAAPAAPSKAPPDVAKPAGDHKPGATAHAADMKPAVTPAPKKI